MKTATSGAVLSTVFEAIQKIIGKQQFIICGHSYGGYLALGMAKRFSQFIQGIFLTCPVVTADSNRRLVAKPLNLFQDKIVPDSNAEYFDEYLDMTVNINATSWKSYQELVVPAIQAADQGFLKKLTSNNNYPFTFESKLQNTIIQMPLTMLVGRHDTVVGYQEQLNLAGYAKQGNMILLYHAGHNLPLDQPEAIAFHFDHFLSELKLPNL